MNILIVIPTYNERDSIGTLLKQLVTIDQSLPINVNILIVDDDSPDKTAAYIESLDFKNVNILSRTGKFGLGSAYKFAIKTALQEYDFDYLVTMDGDGSHQVKDLIMMLKSIPTDASLILGSRWISGGGIRNWSKFRIWLSKAGTRYARFALRLKIHDLTGGFRIYPRRTLERINFNEITSNGYCYQIEMAFAIEHLNRIQIGAGDFKTIELPITFIERVNGSSKMSLKIVLEAIWQVTKMGLRLRLRPNADKLHYVK
ncbi:MAG: polyprenol monophosphomannose synthase [Candidatus Nanopelagicaceae bacterium]